MARLFADAGAVAIVALVSPFAADRDGARRLHAEAGLPFLEVFVDTPLDECERRDPKGLYARQRSGSLHGLTGRDAPYEPPAGARPAGADHRRGRRGQHRARARRGARSAAP